MMEETLNTAIDKYLNHVSPIAGDVVHVTMNPMDYVGLKLDGITHEPVIYTTDPLMSKGNFTVNSYSVKK